MLRNFIGLTPHRFLTNTERALTRSINTHNRNPFEGMASRGTPFPPLPVATNLDPRTLSDFFQGGAKAVNIGNNSNIVVDPEVFEEAIRRMDSIDDRVSADVFTLLCEVEEMCATIFQAPATVNRIRSLCDEVKSVVRPGREATENIVIDTRQFIHRISDIDHGNTSEIAISQAAVEQAVQMAHRVAAGQANSMSRTAQAYASQAVRLNQEAARERRRAEDIQRQIDEAMAEGD